MTGTRQSGPERERAGDRKAAGGGQQPGQPHPAHDPPASPTPPEPRHHEEPMHDPPMQPEHDRGASSDVRNPGPREIVQNPDDVVFDENREGR